MLTVVSCLGAIKITFTAFADVYFLRGSLLASELQACRHQQRLLSLFIVGLTVGPTKQNITPKLKPVQCEIEQSLGFGVSGFLNWSPLLKLQGLQYRSDGPWILLCLYVSRRMFMWLSCGTKVFIFLVFLWDGKKIISHCGGSKYREYLCGTFMKYVRISLHASMLTFFFSFLDEGPSHHSLKAFCATC